LENVSPTVPTEDNGADAATPHVTTDDTHAHTHTHTSCVTFVTLLEAKLASSAHCSWWAWPRGHAGLILRNPFCVAVPHIDSRPQRDV